MKLAASKVDFRPGDKVGVKVVFAAPDVVAVVEAAGRVVVLAVEAVGTGAVVGTEQNFVLFASLHSADELCEQ